MPEAAQSELIRYDPASGTASGKYPWQAEERDRWFTCRWETAEGTCIEQYRRTAHAHAIGRMLLAELRAGAGTAPAAVEVYEYDSDLGTRPAVEISTGALASIPNAAPLARVTDPRPVGRDLERFERDLEAARMAKRRFDADLARMIQSMQQAHLVPAPEDPDYRSANQLAAMTKGVLSRPTVLKALSCEEDEADK